MPQQSALPLATFSFLNVIYVICQGLHMKVRKQFLEVVSLLSCGSQRLNSEYLASKLAPLSAEPPFQPALVLFGWLGFLLSYVPETGSHHVVIKLTEILGAGD